MQGELVRIEAEDGLELVGFYAAPDGPAARRAILHTHGLAGNFYENRFVSAIARAVVEKGLAFLTYNNRGHEYRSDNLRGRGAETTSHLGGASWEIFEDCVHDIRGSADFLAGRGHRDVYFEGHSLGTNKIVYYLTSRRDPRAVGAILISPPDVFGLRDARAGERLEGIVARACSLVRDGSSDTLMEDSGYIVPLSAATILSMYGDRSTTDVFPFRLGARGDYSRLESIGVPVLATFGTVEEAVTVPVESAAALVEAHAGSAPAVRVAAIEGANHVYWGHEDELAALVGGFVEP